MTMWTRTLAVAALLFACTGPDPAMADGGKAKAKAKAKAAAKPATKDGPREVAILAGGCFWGMEDVMRLAPGIESIEVGYAGGKSKKVTYEEVETGESGHAEAVRIVFDPSVISYEDLLLDWYFRGHNPTHWMHQNNDQGPQYRSAIFTTTKDQATVAKAAKDKVDKSGKWKDKVVTQIEPATTFVRAEDYHQDYLIKHPDGYNDHYLRSFTY
jgi:methionine-S-sulfoxide reductase